MFDDNSTVLYSKEALQKFKDHYSDCGLDYTTDGLGWFTDSSTRLFWICFINGIA